MADMRILITMVGNDLASSPIRAVQASLRGLEDSAGRTGGILNQIGQALSAGAGIMAGVTAFNAVAQAINFTKDAILGFNGLIEVTAVRMEALTKMNMVRIHMEVDSAEAQAAIHKVAQAMTVNLQVAARDSTMSIETAFKTAQRLMGIGMMPDVATTVVEDLGTVGTALGLTKAQADLAGLAISQIGAKGKVAAEEMNRQLPNAGIEAWGMLTKYINDTPDLLRDLNGGIEANQGQVRAWATANKISAEVFFKAWHAFANDPALLAGAQKVLGTWTGAMERLEEASKMLISRAFEPIFGVATRVAAVLAELAANDRVIGFFSGLGSSVQGFFGALDRTFGSLSAVRGVFESFSTEVTNFIQNIKPERLGGGGQGIMQALLGSFNFSDELKRRFADGSAGIGDIVMAMLKGIGDRVVAFGTEMFGGGFKLMTQFADGIMQGGVTVVTNAANMVAGLISGFFIGQSPVPYGPLNKMAPGGKTLMENYVASMPEGLTGLSDVAGQIFGTFQQIDGSLAMPTGNAGLKAAAGNLASLRSAAESVSDTIRGLDSEIAGIQSANQGITFAMDDIKDHYAGIISEAQKHVDAIMKVNDLMDRERDIALDLKDLQLSQALIEAQGDPVLRAQLATRLEMDRMRKDDLNLQKERIKLNADAAESNSGIQEKLFAIEEKRNALQQKMEGVKDPDQRKKLQDQVTSLNNDAAALRIQQQRAKYETDQAQKPFNQGILAIDQDILDARIEQSKLVDKVAVAQLTGEKQLNDATQARFDLEERIEKLKRDQLALPFKQQIDDAKSAMAEQLEPLQQVKDINDRTLKLLQAQRSEWQAMAKEIADAIQPLAAAEAKSKTAAGGAAGPGGVDLAKLKLQRDEEAKELAKTQREAAEAAGAEAGKKFATAIGASIQASWLNIVGAVMGGMFGISMLGPILGPLAFPVGALFGERLVEGLQAKIPNLNARLLDIGGTILSVFANDWNPEGFGKALIGKDANGNDVFRDVPIDPWVKSVGLFFMRIRDQLGPVFTKLLSGDLGGATNAFGDFLTKQFGGINWEQVFLTLKGWWEKFTKAAGDGWNILTTWLADQVGKIKWDRVWSVGVVPMWDGLVAMGTSALSRFGPWFQEQMRKVNWREIGRIVGRLLVDGFVLVMSLIGDIVLAILEGIKNAITGGKADNAISEIVTGLINGIFDGENWGRILGPRTPAFLAGLFAIMFAPAAVTTALAAALGAIPLIGPAAAAVVGGGAAAGAGGRALIGGAAQNAAVGAFTNAPAVVRTVVGVQPQPFNLQQAAATASTNIATQERIAAREALMQARVDERAVQVAARQDAAEILQTAREQVAADKTAGDIALREKRLLDTKIAAEARDAQLAEAVKAEQAAGVEVKRLVDAGKVEAKALIDQAKTDAAARISAAQTNNAAQQLASKAEIAAQTNAAKAEIAGLKSDLTTVINGITANAEAKLQTFSTKINSDLKTYVAQVNENLRLDKADLILENKLQMAKNLQDQHLANRIDMGGQGVQSTEGLENMARVRAGNLRLKMEMDTEIAAQKAEAVREIDDVTTTARARIAQESARLNADTDARTRVLRTTVSSAIQDVEATLKTNTAKALDDIERISKARLETANARAAEIVAKANVEAEALGEARAIEGARIVAKANVEAEAMRVAALVQHEAAMQEIRFAVDDGNARIRAAGRQTLADIVAGRAPAVPDVPGGPRPPTDPFTPPRDPFTPPRPPGPPTPGGVGTAESRARPTADFLADLQAEDARVVAASRARSVGTLAADADAVAALPRVVSTGWVDSLPRITAEQAVVANERARFVAMLEEDAAAVAKLPVPMTPKEWSAEFAEREKIFTAAERQKLLDLVFGEGVTTAAPDRPPVPKPPVASAPPRLTGDQPPRPPPPPIGGGATAVGETQSEFLAGLRTASDEAAVALAETSKSASGFSLVFKAFMENPWVQRMMKVVDVTAKPVMVLQGATDAASESALLGSTSSANTKLSQISKGEADPSTLTPDDVKAMLEFMGFGKGSFSNSGPGLLGNTQSRDLGEQTFKNVFSAGPSGQGFSPETQAVIDQAYKDALGPPPGMFDGWLEALASATTAITNLWNAQDIAYKAQQAANIEWSRTHTPDGQLRVNNPPEEGHTPPLPPEPVPTTTISEMNQAQVSLITKEAADRIRNDLNPFLHPDSTPRLGELMPDGSQRAGQHVEHTGVESVLAGKTLERQVSENRDPFVTATGELRGTNRPEEGSRGDPTIAILNEQHAVDLAEATKFAKDIAVSYLSGFTTTLDQDTSWAEAVRVLGIEKTNQIMSDAIKAKSPSEVTKQFAVDWIMGWVSVISADKNVETENRFLALRAINEFKAGLDAGWVDTLSPWFAQLGTAMVTAMGDAPFAGAGTTLMAGLLAELESAWASTSGISAFFERLGPSMIVAMGDPSADFTTLAFTIMNALDIQLEYQWTQVISPFFEGLAPAMIVAMGDPASYFTTLAYDLMTALYDQIQYQWLQVLSPFFAQFGQAMITAMGDVPALFVVVWTAVGTATTTAWAKINTDTIAGWATITATLVAAQDEELANVGTWSTAFTLVLTTLATDSGTNAEAIGTAIQDGILLSLRNEEKQGELNAAMNTVVGTLLSEAKRTLGIASPSTEFALVGDMAGQGLLVGFTQSIADGTNTVLESIGTLVEKARALMTSAFSGGGGGFGSFDPFGTGGLGGGSNEDKAGQAAEGVGIDRAKFLRQIGQESGFSDQPAHDSAAGPIRGIAQMSPRIAQQAADLLGVTTDELWASVDLQLQGAAAIMKTYLVKFGTWRNALIAYNAGEGAVGGPLSAETLHYLDVILGPGQGGAAPAAGAAVKPLGTIVKSQMDNPLSTEDAKNFCGPYAAMIFAKVTGRNPTFEETKRLALKVGWTQSQGMAGIKSEMALMGLMGINAVQEEATPANINTAIGRGEPVAISTPKHYFVATGGTAEKGLNVGATGTVAGGKTIMTLAEIKALGGGLDGIIDLDDRVVIANKAAAASTIVLSAAQKDNGVWAQTMADQQQGLTNVLSQQAPPGRAATDALKSMSEVIGPIERQVAGGTSSVANLNFKLIDLARATGLNTKPWEDFASGSMDAGEAMEELILQSENLGPEFKAIADYTRTAGSSSNEASLRFLQAIINYGKAKPVLDSVGKAAESAADKTVAAGKTIADAMIEMMGNRDSIIAATKNAITDAVAGAKPGGKAPAPDKALATAAPKVDVVAVSYENLTKATEASTTATKVYAQAINDLSTKKLEDQVSGWGNVTDAIGKAISKLKDFEDMVKEVQDATGGSLPSFKAAGGPVWGGQSYWVGEQGPELLHIASGSNGYVIPNDRVGGRNGRGGGSGGGDVHIHMPEGLMVGTAEQVVSLLMPHIDHHVSDQSRIGGY